MVVSLEEKLADHKVIIWAPYIICAKFYGMHKQLWTDFSLN